MDAEDKKAKAPKQPTSDVSREGFNMEGRNRGAKQITRSANISLEGLIDELGNGFGNRSASPTLSPGSSRAQSPGIATLTSPLSEFNGAARNRNGPNPLFGGPSGLSGRQDSTPAVAPFLPTGLAQAKNTSSPTPSLCGSKFTPLKRVKKGPASAKEGPPTTPGEIHTHTKRPSITSGTTEVASTSPGAIDAADYGIHGKKLATMFSNPAANTPPSQGTDGDGTSQDLVLLHISLIIPPNSSPAYARHQRKMLRRKRLEDESSSLSVSDLGYSDEEGTGDDIDREDLEPGPLSMLSPVVYQRGILIPHPRGDYVLLQREVGKTLGLPFVNGEDGENVATDEFGGVQGKGWQMRVYARNGWLTKGAWERAWREMERIDVEILETERAGGKQKKTGRKPKTKQIQDVTTKSMGSRSGSHLREGYVGLAGDSLGFSTAGCDTTADVGDTSANLGPEDVYSDPGSLDEDLSASRIDVDDGNIYDDAPAEGIKRKDTNEVSDDEDLGPDDSIPFFPPSSMGPGLKRTPLALENGTVGDGELEEAYRAHGESLDDPAIDENFPHDITDLHDAPPSPIGSTKETPSPSHSRSNSPSSAKHQGKSSIGKSRQVHPYQYILDLLKPIVLTGLVVTGAMYFFGPTHKRNGRYGSWTMRNGKQSHMDEENFDMDQDVEDHCAGYARDAEMWRSWKNSHKDSGISSGGMSKKGVHGDWTVTVTQTVTQRIVNAGATQIVVEIPSGEAQFPLGPLGLSERETTESEELPIETAVDGTAAIPVPTSVEGVVDDAEGKAPDGAAEEDASKLDAPESTEEVASEGAEEETEHEEDIVTEEAVPNSNWFGKIGKMF